MRNNQQITESLNRKIIENEKRMQNLVNQTETKTKSKSLYEIANTNNSNTKAKKRQHKKNKSQEEVKTIYSNKPKKLKMNFSNDQYNDNSEDSDIILNKIEKKLQSYSKKKDKKIEKKLNFNDSYLKKNSDKNNNTKDESTFSNSKKVNKKELNIIINRLYKNEPKKRKKIENEKNNSITVDSTSKTVKHATKKSKVNFNELYSRFEDDIKKRNENLEKKREELNNNNKTIYTHKPKLNINKKFFDEQNNEDFLERQRKYIEEKKQKEEKYREELIKKEDENIKKTNILSKINNKNKKEIDKKINDFADWDKNRKKRIEQKQKENEDKLVNEFNYMPKISKRSQSLARKNKNIKNEKNVFNRLAKNDDVLKEKQEILIQLYTPTFKPNIVIKKRKKKALISNKEKEFDTISKKFRSKEFDDNSESDFDEDKSDSFLNNYENNIFTEENIQTAYRNALFHKHKK
jgi:hypothetical protein